MKKIFLALLLIIPAFYANAQRVKAWNDQLDSFIDLFNQIDTSLDQLNSQNGIENTFTYTYFEPNVENAASRYSLTDEGNVIKETTIFDSNEFNNVDGQLLEDAKSLAVQHLANGARKDSRMNSIINEFSKRGINIFIVYTTEKNGDKLSEQIIITPKEILSAK